MKKSLLTVVSAFALLLSSCVKHGIIPPGNTINYCRITSITGPNQGLINDTLTFYYNPDGTPSHVDRAIVTDGSPKYIFRYDKQGRLIDFIGAFNNGAADFWIRYFYDEAAHTVIDTLYTLALQYQTWPPIFFGDKESEVKRYDELGRIVSYQYFFLGLPNVDTSIEFNSQAYTYNREGDVEGYPYDNKIDFHRTNPVWQFVDNDYNNNNVVPIEQYNNYGLPSEMVNNNPYPFLFDLELQSLTIHYSCDAPVRKEGL